MKQANGAKGGVNTKMEKCHCYIRQDQYYALKRLSLVLNRTFSSLFREGIDEVLKAHQKERDGD